MKQELLNSANALLLDCQMIAINSQETAQEANKLRDLEVKIRKGLEKIKVEEKEPYLRKCQEIDLEYRGYTALLSNIKDELTPKINDWLLAEKRRKEEELAKLREEEERAKEAAIARLEAQGMGDNGVSNIEVDAALNEANELEKARKDAEFANRKTSLRGGDARSVSLKEVWSVEVIDPIALVKALAANPDVQAAAVKVANQMVKASKAALVLDGVKPVSKETI